MEYTEKTGGFLEAMSDVVTSGGQLYCGNGKDSANVVVRGKKCFTYWQENSKRHGEVIDLCNFLNIPSEAMTGGRVARYLINEVLKLPYKETYWQKKYRQLAIQGNHWHYYHVIPNETFYGVEFDLKSAYISSLLTMPTLLYEDGRGYIQDNEAMEFLRELTPYLPKWFRLQLLGCVASWKFSFLCRDKNNPENPELIRKEIRKIGYNAAFNCVHRAILRNYKIMQKVHQIGGKHIKRMHTDSFFLSCECPSSTEENIFEYLSEKGVSVDIKALGRAHFFDLNSGFVGRKFIGAKPEITELMKTNKLKMQRELFPKSVWSRYEDKIKQSGFYEKYVNDETVEIPEPTQLELWHNASIA